MKLSTYNSLLTNKHTCLVASIGKCGYEGYREIQIMYKNGTFHVNITDGYFTLKTFQQSTGLKSALNIAEGYAKSL